MSIKHDGSVSVDLHWNQYISTWSADSSIQSTFLYPSLITDNIIPYKQLLGSAEIQYFSFTMSPILNCTYFTLYFSTYYIDGGDGGSRTRVQDKSICSHSQVYSV